MSPKSKVQSQCKIHCFAGVAQLVRARGSYPRCPGFKSLHRHHLSGCDGCDGCGGCDRCAGCTHRTSLALARSAPIAPIAPIAPVMLHRLRPSHHPATRTASARDSRVAVALSGGADSVALLFVLREIAAAEGFHVAGAAHLNHQLRGADADARRGVLPAPVRRPRRCRSTSSASTSLTLARAAGVSIEQAAHDARHEFFARAAARLDATAVAVAHTETTRPRRFCCGCCAARARGAGGMHPRAGLVVRPFIETSRAEVRAFLERAADRVSRGRDQRRSRHPAQSHPSRAAAAARGALHAGHRRRARSRGRDRARGRRVSSTRRRGARPRGSSRTRRAGVELDCGRRCCAEPPAIARRVIRLAQQIASGRPLRRLRAVEAVLRFAVSKSTGQLDLPGHRVNRRGDSARLNKSRGREKPVTGRRLQLIGSTSRGGGGARGGLRDFGRYEDCAVGRSPGHEVWRLAGRGDEAVRRSGPAGRAAGGAEPASGRPFRPAGLEGRKKLQDFFVDAKVDRVERDITPVVVDRRGRLCGSPGTRSPRSFGSRTATKPW